MCRVASNASGSIQSVTSASTEAVTTEEATTEETPSEVLPGVTASVIYDGVYVHTEQSSESDIIATVNSGEMFDVVSQDESWIGVQLYDRIYFNRICKCGCLTSVVVYMSTPHPGTTQ